MAKANFQLPLAAPLVTMQKKKTYEGNNLRICINNYS